MPIRIAITMLCGVGLYVSVFMLRKLRRARRGELTETSVVESPRARLFGTPNAAFGIAYYLLLAAAVWTVAAAGAPAAAVAVLAVVALVPAAVSAFLAYSLLYVTRASCPYCWTAHAINWSLPILLFGLFKISY